jgi:hypothetical protein
MGPATSRTLKVAGALCSRFDPLKWSAHTWINQYTIAPARTMVRVLGCCIVVLIPRFRMSSISERATGWP